MMKYYKLLFLPVWIILLLTACQEQQNTRIKIVCTGDVHGHLFPYDILTGDSAHGSLARVSSYLKEQRKRSAFGDNVIYLDNGDMLQGSPATYCYNTYAIGLPHVAAEALNYLGCDAVVWGNNDIETGGATYQRYADDLAGTVLGGNILLEGSENPLVAPYTIVEREGIQIAILGLTTPAIPHWIPQCQWQELEFVDMERSARRWMEYLHEHVQPDIVVGLFHSGYEGGISTDEYAENATRAVAEHVPGFDAIFYGHDHRARIDEIINVAGDTVLLLNPGRDAYHVATLDIEIKKEGRVSLNPALVDMDAYAPDPAYMAALASHEERINKYVDRSIGVSTQAASTNDALFGPSAFMDFIHQMQLDISGARVSFAAPLTYNDMLPEGEVKVRDIYRLFPYENTLYMLWLTGQEIKDYLEMSYSMWTNQMSSSEEHLLLLDASKEHFQYPFYYFDSAAGIVYEVDVTQPKGHKVSIKHMADGKPFCMDEYYMVAMNSYRANGGGGLLTHGAGITHDQMLERIEYTTTTDLRFYMLNYIEIHKRVTPKTLNQWKFVPEYWTKPAAQRDRKALGLSEKEE